MASAITLKGIDQAISGLEYKNESTLKYRFVQYIREFYTREDCVESLTRIDHAELIRNLWDTDGSLEEIKNKRKNLNSIRSSVNVDLKKLYDKGENPEGIKIGTDNIFVMSEDAKDNILKKLGHDLKPDGTLKLEQIMDILKLAKETVSSSIALEETVLKGNPSKVDQLKDLIRGLSEKVGLGLLESSKTASEAEGRQTESKEPRSDFSEVEAVGDIGEEAVLEEIDDCEIQEVLEEVEEKEEDEFLESVEDLEIDDDVEALEYVDAFGDGDAREGSDLGEAAAVAEVGGGADRVETSGKDADKGFGFGETAEGPAPEDDEPGTDPIEMDEILEDLEEDVEEIADIDDSEIVEDVEDVEIDGVNDLEDAEDLEEDIEEIAAIDDSEIVEEVEDVEVDRVSDVESDGMDEATESYGSVETEPDDFPSGLASLPEVEDAADRVVDENPEEDVFAGRGEGPGTDFESGVKIDDGVVTGDKEGRSNGKGSGYGDFDGIGANVEIEAVKDIEDIEIDGVDDVEDVDDLEEGVEEIAGIDDHEIVDDVEDVEIDAFDEVEDIKDLEEDVGDTEDIDDEEIFDDAQNVAEVGVFECAGDRNSEESSEGIEGVDDDKIVESRGNKKDADPTAKRDEYDTSENRLNAKDGENGSEQLGLPVESLGQEYSIEADGKLKKDRLLAEEFDGYLGSMDRYYNQYILIPGGEYLIGSKHPIKDEKPEQIVRLGTFYFGRFSITNGLFEIFVEKTGYKTTAEKVGYGTVYYGRFEKKKDAITGLITSIWNSSLYCKTVEGACWYRPSGPESSLYNKRNHPVVQISMEDALAFAAWTGKRLPTEKEWEAASRTSNGWIFPWGQEWEKDACNIEDSCMADTTPVDKYIQFENDFGIVDTLGNVLEWTHDDFDSVSKNNESKYQIVKGGSWVSGNGLRLSSRFKVSPESHSNILGFRCVAY